MKNPRTNKFWLSWVHKPEMGEFELHSPWWISGSRISAGRLPSMSHGTSQRYALPFNLLMKRRPKKLSCRLTTTALNLWNGDSANTDMKTGYRSQADFQNASGCVGELNTPASAATLSGQERMRDEKQENSKTDVQREARFRGFAGRYAARGRYVFAGGGYRLANRRRFQGI